MDSDSESQDSDEGRRFRFETTRKDAASLPQARRKISPQRNRRIERYKSRSRTRSRSRDRSSRDERSRHTKDDSSRRNRLSNDRDSNNKRSSKERGLKDGKSRNSSRDSSSRRHEKDSRSTRTKDSRGYDSREFRDRSRDRNESKHKSKSRDKHKRQSRDKSREKSNQDEKKTDLNISPMETEEVKLEKQKTDETRPEKQKLEEVRPEKQKLEEVRPEKQKLEEVRPEKQKAAKKQHTEESEKVNHKNVEKTTESGNSNPIDVSDYAVNRTSLKVGSVPAPKKSKSFFDRVVNKRANEDSSGLYGPALPPQLEKKLFEAREMEIETEKTVDKKQSTLIPAASNDPQTIGPALSSNQPPSTEEGNYTPERVEESNPVKETGQLNKEEEEGEEEEEEDAFGPALPPHLERRKVVGPMLPENFTVSDTNDESMNNSQESNKEEEEEDDDTLGPLPADHPAARDSYVQLQLEHRARQVKARFRDKTSPEKNKREEWMVELPPAHAVALGLESIKRKFKTSEGPDMSDRSVWTDTPADRLKKQKEKEENRFVPSEESSKKSKKSKDKDKDKSADLDEEKPESLLDMHLKTVKRKKKKLEKEAKELGLSTRRPFDRDVDLQVNRLDDARKKKIFEKASRLNDRFTVGKI